MKNNEDILQERVKAFNNRIEPRVGDYVFIPSTDDRIPEYTRITHDWGDHLQTGGTENGSYYMGLGYLSYSGGLDSGIKTADLIPTEEIKLGSVWFFDGDIMGAGRSVYFNVPMRVFKVKEDADISGIYSRDCPYHLSVLDKSAHDRTCNYWYIITIHATSHTAFTTEYELREWLAANRLGLTKELTPVGTRSDQMLKYISI